MLKAVEDLKDQVKKTKAAQKQIDLKTVQGVAAIIAEHGFCALDASKQTFRSQEERSAHRFVASHCEMLTKKCLAYAGLSHEEVQKQAIGIATEVHRLRSKREDQP